jgi:hypothetical protein
MKRKHEPQSLEHEITILYAAGSLVTVAKELLNYSFDIVGVQEFRWEGDGNEPAGEYTFLDGEGNENRLIKYSFLSA